MPYTLPVIPSVADYSFGASIGPASNSFYNFRLKWNSRALLWFMDVSDISGNPIANGLAIVIGTPIGGNSTHILFRGGSFYAVDASNRNADAGFDDLGTRVSIQYWTIGDLITATIGERV